MSFTDPTQLVDSLPDHVLSQNEAEDLIDKSTEKVRFLPATITQGPTRKGVSIVSMIFPQNERMVTIGFDPDEKCWGVLNDFSDEELSEEEWDDLVADFLQDKYGGPVGFGDYH